MVSFSTSSGGAQKHLPLASNNSSGIGPATNPCCSGGGDLQFSFGSGGRRTNNKQHKLLALSLSSSSASRRAQQHQQLGGRGNTILPLASLTALGQQQLQQPLSTSTTTGSSSGKAPDSSPQQPSTTPASRGGGLINIGLLLQAAGGQVSQGSGRSSPAASASSPLVSDDGAGSGDAASSSPGQQQQRWRHKQRSHRQQALATTDQLQQHSQQQQQQVVVLQHPSSTSKQQSSQQQQQHQEQQQQQQQDTSGSPIASLLACAAQAKLLVAGAASAIVSRTAMAPLERVKMDLLLKTSSRSAVDTAVWVWQREGLAGFWKGNGLNLLRTAPFKALNFFSFDVYSKALSGVMSEGNNSTRFIAGAMAGITATLICFPLDVLRTRLMAPWGHKYGGPLTTLKCMVKYEGPGALYAGVVPAVIGMAPSGAVFYGVYDLLKARHLAELNSTSSSSTSQGGTTIKPQQHVELPVLYSLLYGALAGAAAETFLYPLEVIRRKMQLQSMAAGAAVFASTGNNAASAAAQAAAPNILRQHGLKAASGALVPSGAGMGTFGAAGVPGAAAMARIAAACSAIVRVDGVAGFYAGLLPNMLQVLPSAALSYGTYESVKQMLGAV